MSFNQWADLIAFLETEGGRLVIRYDAEDLGVPEDDEPQQRAMVGLEFGKEEPDNPENEMYGGAAYGIGPTLDDALIEAVSQVDIRPRHRKLRTVELPVDDSPPGSVQRHEEAQ